MRSEDLLLLDMVEHARLVRDRMRGLSREEFDRDRMLQLGITHALQIIGEAARQVPEPARQQYPSLPWTVNVGMRHRLVHEYHRIDFDRVWDTALNDIGPLLAVLEPVVQQRIAVSPPAPPSGAAGGGQAPSQP